MNDREMELFVLTIKQAVSIDQLCPDVGMGPSKQMLARRIADRLSFDVSDAEIIEACGRIP